mgnify:FL=1
MKILTRDEKEFLQLMIQEDEKEFNKNFNSFMEQLDEEYRNRI